MESTQQPSVEFTNLIVNSTSELNKSTESMTSWFTCGLTDFHHCAVFIVCSMIFLAGFLGNIVVIVLLSTKGQFQKTAIFVTIILLALSDVMTQTWLYVLEMFVVSNILDLNSLSTSECSSFIVIGVTQFLLSLYALAILALVRYHAIVYPLRMSRFKSRKFVVCLHILTTFIFACLMTIVATVSLQTMTCDEAIRHNKNIACILALAVIATIALLIILHFLKVRRLRQSLSARSYNTKSSIRRMNNVIYLVLCTFILCQLPFFVYDALQMSGASVSKYFSNTLYSVAIIFNVLNHSVNPYIYFLSYFCFQSRQTRETRRTIRESKMPIQNISSMWFNILLRWTLSLPIFWQICFLNAVRSIMPHEAPEFYKIFILQFFTFYIILWTPQFWILT